MRQLIDKKNRIILYLIFLLILSTTNNKIKDNKKNYSINIKNIKVTGLSDSNSLKLLNKLDYFSNKNIFNIKREEISKIISENNVIEEYRIKKIYPSGLNIDIKPTKFIAKIPGSKQLFVGSNGKLITNQMIDETLPYIFGKFNSEEFLSFKKTIDRSNFNFNDFKSISFYPSNRWDILTTNDILIKLPKNNLSESLKHAHSFINNNEFQDNTVIDLRMSNHLIVQ